VLGAVGHTGENVLSIYIGHMSTLTDSSVRMSNPKMIEAFRAFRASASLPLSPRNGKRLTRLRAPAQCSIYAHLGISRDYKVSTYTHRVPSYIEFSYSQVAARSEANG
jgi:hypothetical protein